ncbi:MAG TPA: ubiquitin-like protein Pup [Beutenbergiaceae bacterium]|nr:ubiquitin-like protein Pup [Beutenbergiaceae bacterium]
MARQYEQKRPSDPPEDDTPAPAPTGGAAQAQDSEVDALLDEIDDVLETNAESFVRGFVQKGGQ